MGFALRKKDSTDEGDDGVSVKDRLRAWWNGDVLPPRTAAPGGDGDAADHDSEAAASAGSSSGGSSPWSEVRRQLVQEVWSYGFIGPGGAEYVEKLVSGCSLTAAETMLEIGTGMGGAARTIIGKFGNYVTGYERDENLTAAAMRHAVTYEIEDKLEVTTSPFEKIDPKAKYFRAALLRNVVYTVKDKEGLISRVADALKAGESYLIMTDFFFDHEDESSELAAWKAVEERRVHPWSRDAAVKAIEGAGLQPRIIDDESDDYCAMVLEAWSDYMKTIDRADLSPELGRELAREGEFWARRVAAIKAGVLRYYRIEALKIS